MTDKNIGLLLIKSLQCISLQNIFYITRQILFTTKVLLLVPCYNLIQGLQTCFNLLKMIIKRITEEAEDDNNITKIFNNIKILILKQEDLLILFLVENQQSDLNFKEYYSILDECKH